MGPNPINQAVDTSDILVSRCIMDSKVRLDGLDKDSAAAAPIHHQPKSTKTFSQEDGLLATRVAC